ncbi:TlpA family protein disulfide reductase [Marinifilum flexuosum]|uniref:TlpA family protein disulfide reductase n=1 Tax=Marinifilum flexuosum TaxID=1117708 RepID=UPI0024947275|nr:TlpA disulfide reductase family protein [Marinifilum flexuosum]
MKKHIPVFFFFVIVVLVLLSVEAYNSKQFYKESEMLPDLSLKKINGKIVSLSDYQGKKLFITVWATWCGPCCGEIPYLQKIEKEYHDKNIVFFSVSVDRDIEKWKKKVNDDKLGGIQINVGQRNSISKDYMITGIPRFMLFDNEGKIVSVNAPCPSQKEKIEKLFNSLS